MPALARIGVHGGARPLLIPSRGHDGGELMRFSSAMWLRQEEEVMTDPSPSF